ncbi:ESX secretion-associated protein EspG [Nocardia abscessus]|uniref:ESX secretion-associated protein EspG n=1 Tax=Nocardia abscessus TaxID=120957 RepID=UPI00245589F4|nr:ESX secretion-associated protein EspG [Nocardia abscessus]
MSDTWEFSGLEFAAAWNAVKETLPEPFVYLSGTTYYDDACRQKYEAWQRIRARWGHELEELMAVLAVPDIRLVIRGIDGRDARNAKGSIRMLASRKGNRAFLVAQKPGTEERTGGFTVVEHDVLTLGHSVAAALPTVDAGQRSAFDLIEHAGKGDGLDYSYGRSLVNDVEDRAASRSESFDRAPAATVGTIVVEQGHSRFGPRGITRSHLGWRDLVDDGRYVIVPGKPPTVVAADVRRLAELINARIVEVVQSIKDERM